MQRIVILGNAGSGKSTLAREVGERLKLPVVHLDKLFWGPGWSKPQYEVFRARVSEAISGDDWVCEGNYHWQTFDLRLPRADLVVWLDTPRTTCLSRVVLRSALNRPRPDFPAGCSERLDKEYLSFLRYIWNFDRNSRPHIEAERLARGPLVPVMRLRGSRQISDFVSSLARRQTQKR
ncbi:AAA family ATPase [Mesorhizobium sp.]|uniref:AAA family ATPase n=1 Tax=Mesorhizobium sp. TaxID=1871066 RepID=UPI00121B3340|nr:AAA family ATPase [Mesorhizobium sp.]TIO08328.1 MAG: AAA family ATPase [Mesorhizobium sp.]TIO36469.1 MAG: AAA family ATPase [Mesorhizobium sp.]TIP08592.1 MAG: AAA family ATPase [Mesorhizobium sp.]